MEEMEAAAAPESGKLARQLFDVLEETAHEHRRRLSQGNVDQLRRMMDDAAVELTAIDDIDRQAVAIELAKHDLRRLIGYAVDEAETLGTLEAYPEDILGERTLGAAFLRFCPCPPFCR